jgi:RNA-directed DNA polymerase
VAIPKPGGGEREVGIPTVLDQFIQQAVLQVLQPLFDPTFSDASYGFRPVSWNSCVRADWRLVTDLDDRTIEILGGRGPIL